MENLMLLLATSLVVRLAPNKKERNKFIGNTGCSSLVFSAHARFRKSVTESGDDLYFYEHEEAGLAYGVICVQLNQDYELQEATDLLVHYMDALKGPFYILHQTGLKKETDWNSESTRKLVDYWQDGDLMDWKVKGYTNGKQIAVLYVKNISLVDVARQDRFLDSFHFPGA